MLREKRKPQIPGMKTIKLTEIKEKIWKLELATIKKPIENKFCEWKFNKRKN